jgi:hypothetical protein
MSDIVDAFETYLFCYTCPIISIIGVFLSTICIGVFLNLTFKENFYNYIRMEIVFSGISLLFYIIRSTYYCKGSIYRTYGVALVHYINRYLRNVSEMEAAVCCILASLEFYLILTNNFKSKYNILKKISYKFVIIIVFVFSLLLFLFRLYEYEIRPIKSNLTTTNQSFIQTYKLEKTEFVKSGIYSFIKTFSYFLLDFLLVLMMVLVNFLIFINVRVLMKQKSCMNSKNNTNKTIKNIKNTNKTVKLMFLIGSINSILGRIPNFIYFICDIFLDPIKYKTLIGVLLPTTYTILAFSFVFKYFLYYLTNILFKKILVNHLYHILIYVKLKKQQN